MNKNFNMIIFAFIQKLFCVIYLTYLYNLIYPSVSPAAKISLRGPLSTVDCIGELFLPAHIPMKKLIHFYNLYYVFMFIIELK